ncbi:MAG: ABC transporter ATP-binding protein [Actinomycetota bacterium]
MREMRVRYDWWGGEPSEPVSLAEAAAAAASAVRLAWAARPGAVAGIVVANGATEAAEVVQLLWGGGLVGAAASGATFRSQLPRLAAMGALKVVAIAGRDVSQALESRLSRDLSRQAEARVLDALAALELADVEAPDFQDRLQQALMATGRHRPIAMSVFALSGLGARMAAAVAAMSAHDRSLVPLAALGAVPQFVLGRKLEDPGRAMGRRGREGREAMYLRSFLTGPGAAHEVRAFASEPWIRARLDELLDRSDEAQAAVERSNRRRSVASSLVRSAAVVPAAARLGLRVAGRRSSVGEGVAGGLASRQFAAGLGRAVAAVNSVRSMAGVTSAYDQFLASLPAPRVPGAGPRPPAALPFTTAVSVRGLRFTYAGSDRPVLDGVDMEVRRGEVVALVGENGCGKTTLAKLICCLYRPTAGQVLWDGVDTAGCDPADVRAGVAAVFQDFVRYPALTAAQNIGIGLPSSMGDRPAIVEAATRAGAHDVIAALPEGYDTVLSRQFGGVELSAGQWQRVALARAFLRDAPLVVLDEPTASLDPRAERDLFDTVTSLYRSRSALLISHRLSSVRSADRICVLSGGRVTETGTHDELVALAGTYAELFEMQARAYR